jgi:hypothetical protein
MTFHDFATVVLVLATSTAFAVGHKNTEQRLVLRPELS